MQIHRSSSTGEGGEHGENLICIRLSIFVLVLSHFLEQISTQSVLLTFEHLQFLGRNSTLILNTYNFWVENVHLVLDSLCFCFTL